MRNWKSLIKTTILSLFILHFALPLPLAQAEEGTWVTVEGTAPMAEVDDAQARSRAIADGMRKAVQKVVGVDISVETLVVNCDLSDDCSIPYGRVVDSEIIKETVDSTHQEGQSTYRVKMKARVAEETEGGDPHFTLEAYLLPRASFKDGDEMLMSIRSTQDCYISVFNILEDEKTVRLIPNSFKTDNFLKANGTFELPDENDRGRGINLRVHAPAGKDTATETLYILALKQPLSFDDIGLQEGIHGVYNGQTAFMKDLIKEIVSIPLSKRAEKLMQYQIKK